MYKKGSTTGSSSLVESWLLWDMMTVVMMLVDQLLADDKVDTAKALKTAPRAAWPSSWIQSAGEIRISSTDGATEVEAAIC